MRFVDCCRCLSYVAFYSCLLRAGCCRLLVDGCLLLVRLLLVVCGLTYVVCVCTSCAGCCVLIFVFVCLSRGAYCLMNVGNV